MQVNCSQFGDFVSDSHFGTDDTAVALSETSHQNIYSTNSGSSQLSGRVAISITLRT